MELLKQTIKEIKAIDTMYLDKKEVLKRLALIKKELDKRSGQLKWDKLNKKFDEVMSNMTDKQFEDWYNSRL